MKLYLLTYYMSIVFYIGPLFLNTKKLHGHMCGWNRAQSAQLLGPYPRM